MLREILHKHLPKNTEVLNTDRSRTDLSTMSSNEKSTIAGAFHLFVLS